MAPSGSNISPVSQTVRPPVGLFGSSWVRCAGRACGGRGFKLEILAQINYPAVWDHREPVHVTTVTSPGFWGAGRSPKTSRRAQWQRVTDTWRTDRHLEDRGEQRAELCSRFSGDMLARAVLCAALLSALCPAGRTEAERDERDVQDYHYSNSNRLVSDSDHCRYTTGTQG